MNILLINVPSRKGSGGFMLPLGLLYVGSIIEKCGHSAKIIDSYLDDVELEEFDNRFFEKIDAIIAEYKPTIIGYGGIATSYGRTKRLSLYIKNNYPQIIQIAGGPLASVYELLLTRTKVDVVFHGETEVSLPLFLKKFEKKEQIYSILGISYLLNKKVVRNDPAEQVKDLDSIPFPAYHLIDLPRYLRPIKDWADDYKTLVNSNPSYSALAEAIKKKTLYIPIVTSKGCTNRCSFCYRHVQGIRQHSVNYIIKHIKYLQEKYNIGGFQFGDELFNSKYDWVMELCDAIEKNNLNIFYMVSGARVDKTDERMLRRLKETGCVIIGYGQESGSDTILKEYRKGVTAQQNCEITKLTKEVGICSCVQLVIGSPGETNETIKETIQFLKDVDAYQYSLNYLIPLPETPIWQYVKERNLIPDVEQYLDLVAEQGGRPLINLTKESDRIWSRWRSLIRKELKLYYYKKVKPKGYLAHILFTSLLNITEEILNPILIRKLIPAAIRERVLHFL